MTDDDGWVFSPFVLDKGQEHLNQGRVFRDADVPGLFWVRSGATSGKAHHTGHLYRVQTDADPDKGTASWITCTCPHGLNVGGGVARCSHVVAVLIATRDRLELPSV